MKFDVTIKDAKTGKIKKQGQLFNLSALLSYQNAATVALIDLGYEKEQPIAWYSIHDTPRKGFGFDTKSGLRFLCLQEAA